MDLRKEIADKIKRENLIPQDGYVILGLSGGPDSRCLFDLLSKLAGEYPFEFCVVHVNHNLRGSDAMADEEYVKKLCEKSGIHCYIFSEDCNKLANELGISSEEAGRRVRYRAFDKVKNFLVAQGIEPDKIVVAVAHNKDDQAETVLFRILRGTGIDGLAGMSVKGKGMFGLELIRPLLNISRKDIEDYCEEYNLKPRVDETNNESIYTRNKIRLELLPILKEKFNPNIVNALVKLAENASEDKDCLWNETEKKYNEVKMDSNELDLAKLRKLPKSITHRIYAHILKNLGVELIEQNHLKAIDEIVYANSGAPSLAVDLPHGIKASLAYDKIVFINENSQGQGELSRWIIREIVKEDYEKYKKTGKIHAAFDKDKLGGNLVVVRRKKDGDYIFLKNLGRKKMQDFLVDNKLPKLYRNDVWVSAVGSEILWIMPNPHFENEDLMNKGRRSGEYNVDNNTKSVIIIEKDN